MKHDKECEMLGGFFQCKCEEREARKPTEWKRVKIAEACGWSFLTLAWSGRLQGVHPKHGARPAHECSSCPIPDYFNDLNACHKMEEEITDWPKYVRAVMRQCNWAFDDTLSDIAVIMSASAARRAEAFGLTLGLWKPGQTEP